MTELNKIKVKIPIHSTVFYFWRRVGLAKKTRYHCFACDFVSTNKNNLDRAHIISKFNKGSNHPANLHLLCDVCHRSSELLEGDSYWEWFKDMRMTNIAYRKIL